MNKDSCIVQSYIMKENSLISISTLVNLLCIYLNQYCLNKSGYVSSFYTTNEFLPFIERLRFNKIDTDILKSVPKIIN